MQGLKMGRVDGIMGYFTDEGLGLSTRDGSPASDAKMIYMRYAAYDKVRNKINGQLINLDIDLILVNKKKIPLSNYLPDLVNYRLVRKPLWVIGYLRNLLRTIARKLGLLEAIYYLQKRFIRRDI